MTQLIVILPTDDVTRARNGRRTIRVTRNSTSTSETFDRGTEQRLRETEEQSVRTTRTIFASDPRRVEQSVDG